MKWDGGPGRCSERDGNFHWSVSSVSFCSFSHPMTRPPKPTIGLREIAGSAAAGSATGATGKFSNSSSGLSVFQTKATSNCFGLPLSSSCGSGRRSYGANSCGNWRSNSLSFFAHYGLLNPPYQRKKRSPKNIQLTAPNAR
jgi:hypothetical protein